MKKIDFLSKLSDLKNSDNEVYEQVVNEIKRQEETLELIPSENTASSSTMEALGSVLTNKYSEGYPQKRYYGGNEYVDEIESLAIERAKELFDVPFANVQPYSGSPANFAVYTAVCEPGDTIMGQSLNDGGHLTHGHKASATSKYFNAVSYGVDDEGFIDLQEARKIALEHKPKLIWVGASAYSREFPFEELAKIADEVGAYLVADTAHISGLVVSGVHKSPKDYAHIITTTTHKTLRGPRGAMIMVTQKGLEKDEKLGQKINSAIFPGLQGGPHNHQTAAIAVALGEALKPEFKEYSKKVVQNCKDLCKYLIDEGFNIVTGGTDNHLLLLDVGEYKGIFMQEACDIAGITLNKNTIPNDKSPFYPSGVRIGTPILTTRNFGEFEMQKVAKWLNLIYLEICEYNLPQGKENRAEYLKNFREDIQKNKNLIVIREEIKELCKEFPLYS